MSSEFQRGGLLGRVLGVPGNIGGSDIARGGSLEKDSLSAFSHPVVSGCMRSSSAHSLGFQYLLLPSPADVSCREDGSMMPNSPKVGRLQVPSEVSARQSDFGVTGVLVEVVLAQSSPLHQVRPEVVIADA